MFFWVRFATSCSRRTELFPGVNDGFARAMEDDGGDCKVGREVRAGAGETVATLVTEEGVVGVGGGCETVTAESAWTEDVSGGSVVIAKPREAVLEEGVRGETGTFRICCCTRPKSMRPLSTESEI